jgi:hypothetical protein
MAKAGDGKCELETENTNRDWRRKIRTGTGDGKYEQDEQELETENTNREVARAETGCGKYELETGNTNWNVEKNWTRKTRTAKSMEA